MVIAPQFDYTTWFSGGLAPASRPGEPVGYIGGDGNFFLAPQFELAGEFGDGLAPVATDTLTWGYIDGNGNLIIGGGYLAALPFSNGLGLVIDATELTEIHSYIDTTGDLVWGPEPWPIAP